MNKYTKKLSWLFVFSLVASLMLVAGSCNQQANKQNDEQKKENKALAEFKDNIHEIGDAVNDAVSSDDTFAEKANDALDDFETKLENFENNMKDSGEKLSSSTQKTLDNLKQESEDLKQQLDKLANESGEQAEQLKANIKDGLKKFGSNVKDFVNKENQD